MRRLAVSGAALAALSCAMVKPVCCQESALGADFRREAQDLRESCGAIKSFFGCAQDLFTDEPLHIAVGSLAPNNGFAAGAAFVAHYTPNERWRLYWNVDAVGAKNGSWRTGVYLSAVPIRRKEITSHFGSADASQKKAGALMEMPILHAYSQTTSLNSITYYGLGQRSSDKPSFFGMSETIAGGNVVWPLPSILRISLLGEVNGRFFDVRNGLASSGVPIAQAYNNVTAPGLLSQPGYAQFGEGIRLGPSFAKDHVRLDYTLNFQEWAANKSSYSFRRFTANLAHVFPLYRNMRSSQPNEINGPDSCAMGPSSSHCPSISRNLEGSFGFLFLYTASYTSAGSEVPFYLDPTLGGSDLNGTTLLPSLPDYRFRGPDMMLFRGSFEHSIYKWPVGMKLMLDEGQVATDVTGLAVKHLSHSYAAGLTLHAGGLPVLELLFCWGGRQGTHTIADLGSSLLGGASRPPLY